MWPILRSATTATHPDAHQLASAYGRSGLGHLAWPLSLVAIQLRLHPRRLARPLRFPHKASSVPGVTEAARDQPPRPRDEAEAKILSVLDALDHYREGTSNVPREDDRILRLPAEAGGRRNVVELGTSNGYAGLWFSLALSKTGGHLTTFDIDKGRFEMVRNNFKKAGVDGIVTRVLGDAHKEAARLKDPIDLLFIDADKQGYLDYLTKLLPLVRPGGLIAAHNMASPPPGPPSSRRSPPTPSSRPCSSTWSPWAWESR